MLKIWAVALCLIFVPIGILVIQNPAKDAPKAGVSKADGGGKGQEQPNRQAANQPSPPSQAISPQPTTPPCDEACQQGRENIKIQNRLALFTGLLVLVGGLQVGSIIWQAFLLRDTRADVNRQANQMERQADLMERQTKILEGSVTVAEKSADAARLNAQAVINAERPWIVISVESPRNNHFVFKATNVGRTPAKISATHCTPIIRKRFEQVEIPADAVTQEALISSPARLLPPTASYVVSDGSAMEDILLAARKSPVDVFTYGRIIYFDTIDPAKEPHETKWLYFYPPFDNAMPVPDPTYSQYNTYT